MNVKHRFVGSMGLAGLKYEKASYGKFSPRLVKSIGVHIGYGFVQAELVACKLCSFGFLGSSFDLHSLRSIEGLGWPRSKASLFVSASYSNEGFFTLPMVFGG